VTTPRVARFSDLDPEVAPLVAGTAANVPDEERTG
jgi:hypothetical protein